MLWPVLIWLQWVMASPRLESFCCMRFDDNDNATDLLNPEFQSITISYNILCIMSSIMSIIGASYQLTPRSPRRPPRGRTELESMLRQNDIICWLAIADLLATVGLSELVLMNSHNFHFIGTIICCIYFSTICCLVVRRWLLPKQSGFDFCRDLYELLAVLSSNEVDLLRY